MKKLIYAVIIIGIQHLTLSVQHSFAQAPYTTPDNLASGNCLDFDGNNDIVNIPNSTSLSFGTGPFSCEFWVRTNNATRSEAVIGNRADGCGDGISWFIVDCPGCGGMLLQVDVTGPGAPSVIIPNVSDDTWHHIAFVRDNNGLYGYLDGELVQTTIATSTNVNSGGPTQIGVNPCSGFWPGGGHFSGQMDEVRMWNVARTQAQIQDNMCVQITGVETGLVAYWNMNEGVGNTVGDLTTNNNDGTRQ